MTEAAETHKPFFEPGQKVRVIDYQGASGWIPVGWGFISEICLLVPPRQAGGPCRIIRGVTQQPADKRYVFGYRVTGGMILRSRMRFKAINLDTGYETDPNQVNTDMIIMPEPCIRSFEIDDVVDWSQCAFQPKRIGDNHGSR